MYVPDVQSFLRIVYCVCGGLGVVGPRAQMPRLCDESAKLLCVQRDCQCDCGTKDKLCGFSGEDPNQCLLSEGKVCCCVNAQACFCEVSNPLPPFVLVLRPLSLSLALSLSLSLFVCAQCVRVKGSNRFRESVYWAIR